MTTKICKICNIEKMVSDFHKHRGMSDGYLNICKLCKIKYQKQYYKTHKATVKDWYKNYMLGKGRETRNLYKIDNKDRLKIWKQNDYFAHKKAYTDRAKEYYINNMDSVKERVGIYAKNRRKVDVGFRMLCNLRRRLGHAITKGYKSAKTMDLVGCSVEHLRQYIENMFQDGMNWGNYGLNGWEIDHIIPCCSYDLTKPEEQIRCFNYTNLQPLWAKENRIKSGSVLNGCHF